MYARQRLTVRLSVVTKPAGQQHVENGAANVYRMQSQFGSVHIPRRRSTIEWTTGVSGTEWMI